MVTEIPVKRPNFWALSVLVSMRSITASLYRGLVGVSTICHNEFFFIKFFNFLVLSLFALAKLMLKSPPSPISQRCLLGKRSQICCSFSTKTSTSPSGGLYTVMMYSGLVQGNLT